MALSTRSLAPYRARAGARVRRDDARRSRASVRARHASHEHVYAYETIDLGRTREGTDFIDLSAHISRAIAASGVREGTVHVVSRHTTTAVTINESEERLIDDARMYFSRLAPATDFYLHNDLDRRYGPKDWPGGDDAWRKQEPKNCHSHLLSMLIGNSVSVPVSEGKTTLGRWQSVMFVELDGPRERTVGIQVVGIK